MGYTNYERWKHRMKLRTASYLAPAGTPSREGGALVAQDLIARKMTRDVSGVDRKVRLLLGTRPGEVGHRYP
jgi:hypothetical protein